ncbi:hypothetical protein T484DRAFT_1608660 [Baffinella frigidus]|nr:hypothetical protein T484DRAFT_1608660 [Cryptophyta sp. CCMP2293]
MHPAPCTLHPAPCTLHPVPCSMHPVPCTLYPAPCALNPAPCTLHPAPPTPERTRSAVAVWHLSEAHWTHAGSAHLARPCVPRSANARPVASLVTCLSSGLA